MVNLRCLALYWSRLVVMALLLVVLAEPPGIITSFKGYTYLFLLDVSASVQWAYPAQRLRRIYHEMITRVLQTGTAQDRVGVIYFAAQPYLALRLQSIQQPLPPLPAMGFVPSHETDLLRALRLAMRLCPASEGTKLIAVTDGAINPRQFAQVQTLAATRLYSLELRPVPGLPPSPELAEVRLQDLAVPPDWPGQSPLPWAVTLTTTRKGRFQLEVRLDAQIVMTRQVLLGTAGYRRLHLCLSGLQPGWHCLAVRVQASSWSDVCPANNELLSWIRVGRQLRLLILTSRPVLWKRWQARPKQEWHTCQPQHCTAELLAGYDVVVFDNVPAHAWETEELTTVVQAVRHGLGLIMVGSEHSFAPGGYTDSVLARALPVWCRPPQQPPLALVLALDTSGSMQGRKLVAAINAAQGVLQALRPSDWLAILTFSDRVQRICALAPLAKRGPAILARLKALQAHGPTDMALVLRQAHQELRDLPPQRQGHVLLLSDGHIAGGQAAQALLSRRVRLIRARGATLSVIATGPQAQFALLQELACLGAGHCYRADYQQLPRVFLNALQALHSIRRRRSKLVWAPGAARWDLPALPTQAYIDALTLTQAKAYAQVVMQTAEGDPVLVLGHYGLGRCVALTTSPFPNWGGSLASASGWRLLQQLIEWTAQRNTTHLQTRWLLEPRHLKVTVRDQQPGFRQLELSLQPSWQQVRVPLLQVSRTCYQARLPLPARLPHRATIALLAAQQLQGRWHLPRTYPPELNSVGQRPLPIFSRQSPPSAPRGHTSLLWPWLLVVLLCYAWDVIERPL